jgi:hypothetical protein
MMWPLKVRQSTVAAAEPGEGEGLGPLAERCVGSTGDGCTFFACGDHLEQQFRAVGVELDVSDLAEEE